MNQDILDGFEDCFSSELTLEEYITFKSSHQRCSVKKGVLKNFAKFTGKHLCQSLFFNKVAGGTFFHKTPLDDWF